MNPYQILGIHQDASEMEIKKAYRDLARKAHPDKGGTEEKFKKINEAYTEIMKGEDPMESFPDINEIFKIFAGLGGFKSMGMEMGLGRGPTIKTKLELTLEQLELGGRFPINYKRNVPTGKFTNSISSTPFGVMNVVIPEETEKIFEVIIEIPKCHDQRKPLFFSRLAKADSLPSGDLEVLIVLVKHPIFTRIPGSLDIQTEFIISLKEALTGFDREIKLLNTEETVKIECRSIVNPYDIKRIQNYGMKYSRDNEDNGDNADDIYGDLLIKFKIQFPVIISEETINIIKNINDL